MKRVTPRTGVPFVIACGFALLAAIAPVPGIYFVRMSAGENIAETRVVVGR